MAWLRLVHIVAGVFWAGSAWFAAFVVIPTARGAGGEGRRFMERLTRRLGPILGAAMLLTVIPGILLYGRMQVLLGRAWATSPSGRALGAGALAALLAVAVGFVVNAPAGVRLARLQRSLQGREPQDADALKVTALETRIARGTQAAAALLLVATGAMAIARYL